MFWKKNNYLLQWLFLVGALLLVEANYCCDLFCKMTELTSNWPIPNRVGQINGFADSNYTIASKLSKSQKKLLMGYVIFTIFMAQWVGQKSSKARGRGFEPRHKLYYFKFDFGSFRKIYIFDLTLVKFFFWFNSPIKSKESTSSGFESQHNISFVQFYTRKYTKLHPFSSINQLFLACFFRKTFFFRIDLFFGKIFASYNWRMKCYQLIHLTSFSRQKILRNQWWKIGELLKFYFGILEFSSKTTKIMVSKD